MSFQSIPTNSYQVTNKIAPSDVPKYENMNIVKHRLHVCSGAGARRAWSLDTGQLLLPWWPGWPGCLLSCLEAWRRGGGSYIIHYKLYTTYHYHTLYSDILLDILTCTLIFTLHYIPLNYTIYTQTLHDLHKAEDTICFVLW